MEWQFFRNTRSPFTHHDFINCLCHTKKVAKTKLQWKYCCKGFCVILKACRVGCFSICEKNTCNSLINITVKCSVKLCVKTSNTTKNSIKMAVDTVKQRSCGKVMFSVMSIHHSVPGGGRGRGAGGACDHYPGCTRTSPDSDPPHQLLPDM